MGQLSANSSLTETLYCLITCSVQMLGVVNKIATKMWEKFNLVII